MAFCYESGDRLGPGFGSDEPVDYERLPTGGHIGDPGVADRIDELHKPRPARTASELALRIAQQADEMGDIATSNTAAQRIK